MTYIQRMLNTRAGEFYNANDVVNSNDLRKRIINVDSRFRNNLTEPSTSFMYNCEHTYKNIIRLRLASVEIPNMFNVFSVARGNLSFVIKALDIFGFTRELKVVIDPGNYTSDELITEIQNELDANFKNGFGIFIQISIHPFTARVTFTNLGVADPATMTPSSGPTESAKNFILDFHSDNYLVKPRKQDFGLGYNLGFRMKLYRATTVTVVGTMDTYSVTSEGCIDVVGDTYMFLCVNDFHCVEQKTDVDYLQCLAKIIIREDKNAVIYDDGSCLLSNEIIFPSPVDINVLNVKLVDLYGCPIDLCGMNFAFSLEITEVLNTALYDFYRNYIWMGTIPSVPYRSVRGSAQPLLKGIGPPF
jgi:hypothetical protein